MIDSIDSNMSLNGLYTPLSARPEPIPGPSSLPFIPSRPASPLPPEPSTSAIPAQEEEEDSKSRTGYVYHTAMMLHEPVDATDNHPEAPKRILEIFRRLRANGLTQRMKRILAREACLEEIRLVHAEDQWKRIEETAHYPSEHLDAIQSYYNRQSLYINAHTARSARLSCGSVIDMCRAVAEGRIRNGFCIVRPPGHHAEPDMEMGFCLYNNAAVAAAWLKVAMPKTMKRILILDWDVHHGNGTQKAFYDNPDVLYISLHRYDNGEFYPGGEYGAADKCGENDGLGRNVNIPWLKAGMGDADYIYAFQQIVMPIALEFNPDFVIDGDDLGECKVTPAGFAHMTHLLASVADGKCVLALEGGYNLDAIANSAVACTQTLLGELPPRMGQLTASSSATEVVALVSREQSRYWSSIRPLHERKEDLPEEVLTVSLTDVLKLHRSHYLYDTYNLINVNLASNGDEAGEQLSAQYDHQVFCSEDVYTNETLVLYLHDMGTVHAELGGMKTEPHLEKSYLVDNTKLILDWVTSSKYAIIDANVLPSLPHGASIESASTPRTQRDLALHLWDCFIDLSAAKNVFLFGQGSACNAIGQIIIERDVKKRVKSIVQICGSHMPPEMPKDMNIRRWYYDKSWVACPTSHPAFLLYLEEGAKRFGRLNDNDETNPARVVTAAWPKILNHLEQALVERPRPAPVAYAPVASTSAVPVALPPPNGVLVEDDGLFPPLLNGMSNGGAGVQIAGTGAAALVEATAGVDSMDLEPSTAV